MQWAHGVVIALIFAHFPSIVHTTATLGGCNGTEPDDT